MISLVIWLFIEVQKAVNREMRLHGKVQHSLRRERCTYAIITTFFALSYIARFYFNDFETGCNMVGSIFFATMVQVLVYLLEGVSMGVMMTFHLVNFKNGTLLSSSSLKHRSFELVRPEELYFFSNE